MGKYVTGYCAVCGRKVTRGEGESGLGGKRIRCDRCLRLRKLVGEGVGGERGANPAQGATDRELSPPHPPARGRTASRRLEGAAFPFGPTLAGLGLSFVAVIAFWWLCRPGRGGVARSVEESPSEREVVDIVQPVTPAVERIVLPVTSPTSATTSRANEVSPTSKATDDVIRADDLATLRAAEGRRGLVQGIVRTAAWSSSGKVFRITFDDQADGFMAVIFPDQMPSFVRRHGDLARMLVGRTVRVHGGIQDYKGRPEVILQEPAQLEIP